MQPSNLSVTDLRGAPIPLEGHEHACFYSAGGTLLARGYTRVVIGGRGAYVEFAPEHMVMEALHVPAGKDWRYTNDNAYYIEHRSHDASAVKVYEQRKTVNYADYRIGMFYISPKALIFRPPAE